MAAAAAPLSLPALEALINAPIRTEALTRLLTLPDPSLDALQAAMRAADGGLPLEDKRRLLVATYPRTVAGKDFNAWALQRGLVRSEADATALRGHLLEIGALVEVGRKDKPSNDEAAWYRLREDEETTVLNTRALYFGPTLPANLLSELLRKRILGMYGQFMNEQGTSVDYKGLAASPKFAEYERAASALQSADLETLGEAEKLAFWINLYNALVIHGYVVLGHPSNAISRLRFFTKTAYVVAGHEFTLDDVEHGVLRANSRTVGGSLLFNKDDPRLNFAMKRKDPRLHFALVCGAKSCPAIRVYRPDNVEHALTEATRNFVGDDECVKIGEDDVVLSKIFDWYSVDFGSSAQDTLRWILPFLSDERRAKLDALLRKGAVTVRFAPYDWSANGVV